MKVRISMLLALLILNHANLMATLPPKEEVKLLKKVMKEKEEAYKATLEYYQAKMADPKKAKGEETDTTKKKDKIDPKAHQALGDQLKAPLLILLSSSPFTKPKKLVERYNNAKEALEKYGKKYIKASTPTPPPTTGSSSPTSSKKDNLESKTKPKVSPTPTSKKITKPSAPTPPASTPKMEMSTMPTTPPTSSSQMPAHPAASSPGMGSMPTPPTSSPTGSPGMGSMPTPK